MKKCIAAIVAALILSAFIIGASACSCSGVEQVGRAYGLVHNYYVASVTVTRNGDKVIKVGFEETEGPASWAKRANIKDETAADVEFTEGGFAKRIGIGSLTFTATDEKATKTPSYKRSGDDVTFEQWVKTEQNAKFYVEAMASGDYRLLKADGSAADIDFSVEKNGLKKGERWLKSKNGYWSGANYSLGWQGNINKMSDYLVRHGFAAYTGNETADDNGFTVGGVQTGATLVDFHDYMKLAKKAYDSAM